MYPGEDDFSDDDDLYFLDGRGDAEPGSTSQLDQAKYHIQRFLSDKKLCTGGTVTKSFMFAKNRIDMVRKYTICDGVDKVYGAMKSVVPVDKASPNSLPEDVRTVTETLSLIAKSGVPQQYAGGMLCLYLELVEGLRLEP